MTRAMQVILLVLAIWFVLGLLVVWAGHRFTVIVRRRRQQAQTDAYWESRKNGGGE